MFYSKYEASKSVNPNAPRRKIYYFIPSFSKHMALLWHWYVSGKRYNAHNVITGIQPASYTPILHKKTPRCRLDNDAGNSPISKT